MIVYRLKLAQVPGTSRFYASGSTRYNYRVKLLRTFIAVELPSEVRRHLFQTGKKMALNIPDRAVRWVAPENVHLTLRFLGDTPEDKVSAVTAELDQITHGFPPFSLHLDELGCFPNRKRPRVIWAGLSGGLKTLNALQSRIETAVQALGWPEEGRPFQPHLTIGRVKDSRQAAELLWDEKLDNYDVPVSAVNLIESQLRPQGPLYTIRHSSLLTGDK
jgi:RNA 2',3'-cyclic 3'-phosphodiesterase